MICIHCKNEIPDSSKFCPECGNSTDNIIQEQDNNKSTIKNEPVINQDNITMGRDNGTLYIYEDHIDFICKDKKSKKIIFSDIKDIYVSGIMKILIITLYNGEKYMLSAGEPKIWEHLIKLHLNSKGKESGSIISNYNGNESAEHKNNISDKSESKSNKSGCLKNALIVMIIFMLLGLCFIVLLIKVAKFVPEEVRNSLQTENESRTEISANNKSNKTYQDNEKGFEVYNYKSEYYGKEVDGSVYLPFEKGKDIILCSEETEETSSNIWYRNEGRITIEDTAVYVRSQYNMYKENKIDYDDFRPDSRVYYLYSINIDEDISKVGTVERHKVKWEKNPVPYLRLRMEIGKEYIYESNGKRRVIKAIGITDVDTGDAGKFKNCLIVEYTVTLFNGMKEDEMYFHRVIRRVYAEDLGLIREDTRYDETVAGDISEEGKVHSSVIYKNGPPEIFREKTVYHPVGNLSVKKLISRFERIGFSHNTSINLKGDTITTFNCPRKETSVCIWQDDDRVEQIWINTVIPAYNKAEYEENMVYTIASLKILVPDKAEKLLKWVLDDRTIKRAFKSIDKKGSFISDAIKKKFSDIRASVFYMVSNDSILPTIEIKHKEEERKEVLQLQPDDLTGHPLDQLKNYLEKYPRVKYSSIAKKNIDEMQSETDKAKAEQEDHECWENAKTEDTIKSYRRYMSQFPSGKNKSDAEERIMVIESEIEETKRLQEEELLWKKASEEDNLESYTNYIATYPEGKYKDQANGRIADIRLKAEEGLKQEEEKIWTKAKEEETIKGYKGYITLYPQGKYKDQAEENIRKIQLKAEEERKQREEQSWQQAEKGNTIASFRKYNSLYPNGKYSKQAADRIKELLMPPDLKSSNPRSAYTNTIGMEFVLVEKGNFIMGNPDADDDSDESPSRNVNISKPFYIGKFEVTQKNWVDIMGTNPSIVKGDNRPVENISWTDIQQFINKLNQEEGHNRYRLPTEAEWEFAAKGGIKSKGSIYSGSGDINEIAWYKNNSTGITKPVGQKSPNELGIYDMTGNVAEWVQDKYDKAYYSRGPAIDPPGAASGFNRVLRGGSWGSDPFYCRVTARDNGGENHRKNSRDGFRLAIGY